MKKSMYLTVILLILTSVGVGVAAGVVSRQHDQVVITQSLEEGDPAVLDGLTVQLATACENLLWETTYLPGVSPKIKTEFSFLDDEYAMSHNNGDTRINHIYLRDYTTGLLHYDEEEENPVGLSKAYQELAAVTLAGEEKERVIRLKDYMDYRNFDITVVVPTDEFSWRFNWKDIRPFEQQVYDDFHAFFKIPVLEDETFSISLERDSKGNVWHLGGGTTQSDRFDFMAQDQYQCVTDKAVYFTFWNRTVKGNIVDTSQIPGGYGIYRLPFTADFDPETETGILTDQLEMVYSIDPQHLVFGLGCSLDKSKLLLHTCEEGEYVLTVLDSDTLEVLQRIPYSPQADDWYLWQDEEQDIFLITLGWEEYALFALGEDGLYHLEFLCEAGNFTLLDAECDMAYDGQRLVLGKTDGYDIAHECSLRFEVYDKNGPIYYGEYQNSLALINGNDSVSDCLPTWAHPIELSW